MVKLVSFSFKDRDLPDADFTFDCRRLLNPHLDPQLRPLDGRDPRVQAFVQDDPMSAAMLIKAISNVRSEHVIAFGCYGGRHRSVAMVELLAKRLRHVKMDVEIEHRALK